MRPPSPPPPHPPAPTIFSQDSVTVYHSLPDPDEHLEKVISINVGVKQDPKWTNQLSEPIVIFPEVLD